MQTTMRPYAWVGEFMGTFTLVFTSVCAGALGAGPLCSALAAGFAVIAMAFTYQGVSGAHFNPALSLAFYMSGRISGRVLTNYVVVQIVAATASALTLRYFLGHEALLQRATVHLAPGVSAAKCFWMEVLLTFFIVETVFYAVFMGTVKQFAPFILGSLIIANSLSGSLLTGAAFNPARALATAVVAWDFRGLWVHLIGPFVGSLISTLFANFRNQRGLLPERDL